MTSGLYQLNCTYTTALRGFRLGARRALVCMHHKRRATTPGAAGASPAYVAGGTPPLSPGSLATPPFGSLFPLPRGSRGRPPHNVAGGTPPGGPPGRREGFPMGRHRLRLPSCRGNG